MTGIYYTANTFGIFFPKRWQIEYFLICVAGAQPEIF